MTTTQHETEATPCATNPRHNLAEDERGTCRACTGKVKADLHGIVNAYALLPDIIGNPLGSNAPRRDVGGRTDERPMPGGDALVLAAGGGDGRGQLRTAHFGDDDRAGDPLSVPYELGRWEDDWRKIRREPAALSKPYVSSAVAYLLRHLGWAASRHPDFPEFATDIHRLRRMLEHATGTTDDPLTAEAPCIDCGAQLVREYRDPVRGSNQEHWGLRDDWSCRGCPRTYTPAEYARAVAQILHDRALGDCNPNEAQARLTP